MLPHWSRIGLLILAFSLSACSSGGSGSTVPANGGTSGEGGATEQSTGDSVSNGGASANDATTDGSVASGGASTGGSAAGGAGSGGSRTGGRATGGAATGGLGAGGSGSGGAGAGGAGPAGSGGFSDFVVRSLTGVGVVKGRVIDGDTGQPVTAAGAHLGGGNPVAVGADGRFEIEGSVAWDVLKVEADGYIAWTREIGVAPGDITITVRLTARPATVQVAPSGTDLALGAAKLSFPANAYSADTAVSAVRLSDRAVAGRGGSARFVDANGVNRRAYALLMVAALDQPLVPVSYTFPVDPKGDATKLVIFELGADGNWINPQLPSVAGEVATVQLAHFSEYVESYEAPSNSCYVEDVQGGAYYDDPTAGTVAVQPGDEVPYGQSVQTTLSITLIYTDGMYLTVAGDPQTVTPSEDNIDAFCTGNPQCVSDLRLATSKPHGRFTIRTRTASTGVRGTVLSYSTRKCGDSVDRILGRLRVTQGTADLQSGGASWTVGTGQEAVACVGCPDPTNPTCCDTTSCPGGCCDEYDECHGAHCVDGLACSPGSSCTRPLTEYECLGQFDGWCDQYCISGCCSACLYTCECTNGGLVCTNPCIDSGILPGCISSGELLVCY